MNLPATPTLELTAALVELGSWLKSTGYSFTTPTPATHQRVLDRPGPRHAQSLRDIFGWSRPFHPGLLPASVVSCMRSASLLHDGNDGLLASRVRYSMLEGELFAHTAYPTDQPDSVFFGPDTYRFAALIRAELERTPLTPASRILDVGCGAGPGGIVAARIAAAAAPALALTDINSHALQFAASNAALAGIEPGFALGDLFAPVDGPFDLIVANPPYLNDQAGRTYRHGGGTWGGALSERIVREGVHRLAPQGRLVLYTGVAMVGGDDPFIGSLRGELDRLRWPWRYREIDPDVFGEELALAAYANVERIAAVALVVTREEA
ncbi:MAG: class I SAM-dependent methyltransferase [Pseudomonadota bacterium]